MFYLWHTETNECKEIEHFFPLKIWKIFRSKCKVHMECGVVCIVCVRMFLLNRSIDTTFI